jgi:co-chaperonin GroES (HSP10)
MAGLRLLRNTLWIEPAIRLQSQSRLYLSPRSQDQDQMQWRVLGCGPGRVTRKGVPVPMEIQPGDFILWKIDSGGSLHDFPDGRLIIDAATVIACWKV